MIAPPRSEILAESVAIRRRSMFGRKSAPLEMRSMMLAAGPTWLCDARARGTSEIKFTQFPSFLGGVKTLNSSLRGDLHFPTRHKPALYLRSRNLPTRSLPPPRHLLEYETSAAALPCASALFHHHLQSHRVPRLCALSSSPALRDLRSFPSLHTLGRCHEGADLPNLPIN